VARNLHAAIGFKAHTGWASAVVLGETDDGVEVVAKARIAMIDGFEAAAVYHRGLEGGLSAAEARPLVEAAFREAGVVARKELAALAAAAGGRWTVRATAILSSGARPLPELEVILRSHPLVHAAEGELYREVLADACRALGLRVDRVPSKELASHAAAAAGMKEKALLARIAAAGAESGKPWAGEQRECALAACVALTGRA
jgi:hypothetical protein